MQSKLLAIVGLAALVSVGVLFYEQKGVEQGGDSSQDATAYLANNIPADSMIFVLNQKPVPIELMYSQDASVEQMVQMFEGMDLDSNPALKFWVQLGAAYFRSISLGAEDLKNQWGFADEIVGAAYFVGLSPVIELQLARPEKFLERLRSAAQSSGFQVVSSTVGEAEFHRVTFLELEGKKFTLLFRTQPGWGRIAIEMPVDEAHNALVAGTTLPEHSIASAGTLERLQGKLGGKDATLMVNFAAMLASITDHNSLAGQMIAALAPEEKTQLASWQTPACRSELEAWVGAAPEWYMTHDMTFDLAARKIDYQGRSLWDIRNAWLASTLMKLNGVLPNYARVDGFDPLYSIALGLNVSQLAPTLIDLHQALIQQSFECEHLQTLQAKAKSTNPAMLGIAMAMVSGLKGASITINDAELAEDKLALNSASALVSVSAVSIRQLLSLIQGFVPELAQIDIPEDGSPVPLQSNRLPSMVPPLQIAIKNDQHAVIMTRDPLSEKLAASFEGLGLEGKGIFNIALNLNGVAEKASKVMQSGILPMGENACATAAMLKETYSNMNAKLSGDMSFSESGMVMNANATQQLPALTSSKVLPGQYQVFYMGQGCRLELTGEETLNSDGSGNNNTRSSLDGCDEIEHEAEFTWEQRGLGLYYHYAKKREREADRCGAAWASWESTAAEEASERCIMLDIKPEGFSCLFQEEDGPYLYMFKRK